VALFAALTLVSPGALAQGQSPTNLDIAVSEGGSRRIELGIGKSVIIDLPRDAKEVFVANPKVANAIVRSTRKIFIIGAADGQTNVVVMDGEGRQIANLDVNIGRDLNTLRRTLKAAMPTSEINIVPVGDTIVLTGSVASAGDASAPVGHGLHCSSRRETPTAGSRDAITSIASPAGASGIDNTSIRFASIAHSVSPRRTARARYGGRSSCSTAAASASGSRTLTVRSAPAPTTTSSPRPPSASAPDDHATSNATAGPDVAIVRRSVKAARSAVRESGVPSGSTATVRPPP
jgi:hypothetical protein